jgi:hypothetical protein
MDVAVPQALGAWSNPLAEMTADHWSIAIRPPPGIRQS